MLGRDRTMALLETGLKCSRVEQTEILAVGQHAYLTRYSENYIHQNVGERDTRITVRAVTGKRIGVASTNQFEEGALRETVEQACEMSRLAPERPDFRSLPGPEPIPDVGMGISRATLECPADLRAAYVERVVSMARDKGVAAAGALTTGSLELGVANSLGVRAYGMTSRADLSCVAMSPDSSGFGQESSFDVSKVDPTRVAEKAVSKCLASRNPVTIPPGEYDVVLEPPAIGDMLLYLAFLGFTAESYQEGRSFMSGKLGQKIAGDNITIWDDGLDPAGFPMPFDFEGVPKRKVTLIENGVARGVVYDSLSAGREARKSTGHAVAQEGFVGSMPINLMMAGGTSSIAEMIASTGKGILVTRFHYVNPVHPVKTIITGMTRDGTFLIEDGKLATGLTNLRFTESILGALSRVELISSEREVRAGMLSMVCPAVKVRGFTFTGTTKS